MYLQDVFEFLSRLQVEIGEPAVISINLSKEAARESCLVVRIEGWVDHPAVLTKEVTITKSFLKDLWRSEDLPRLVAGIWRAKKLSVSSRKSGAS